LNEVLPPCRYTRSIASRVLSAVQLVARRQRARCSSVVSFPEASVFHSSLIIARCGRRGRREDRVGPPDGVLHLRAVTEQPNGATARLLAPGELNQRIETGPRDAGDDGAVVRPDPALNRQLIGETGPASPLVFERDANLRHRPPLRQEDVLDRPVEAAGAA